MARRERFRPLVYGFIFLLLFAHSFSCRRAQQKAEQYGKRALQGISDAERLAIENDLRTIADAINRYYQENNVLPRGSYEDLMQVLTPGYLRLPIRSTQGYSIYYESDGMRYRLGIAGPDGVVGNEDDIVITGP